MNKLVSVVKSFFSFSGKSRKSVILSIVALVEAVAIMVVASSAWVETISSIKISGKGEFEQLLYTQANIGSGSEYTSSIDLSKYFRESGGMHLASASSANGKDVYFPVTQSNDTTFKKYRKTTINDKNVNYYTFSLKVKAATGKCDFFFGAEPTILIDGQPIPTAAPDSATDEEKALSHKLRDAVRLALEFDGETNIYSMDSFSEEVVSSIEGVKSTTIVRSFGSYLTGTTLSDPLFTINNNETKELKVTLWLQDTDRDGTFAGKTISVNNLTLLAGRTTVTFEDYTSRYNSSGDTTWHWASDNSQMFVYDGTKVYPMSLTSGTVPKWQTQILTSVLEDTSKTLYFCRCASGTESIQNQSDNAVLQYWSAGVVNATTVVYRAYGNANNKVGRGTWGNVVELTMSSDNSTFLPLPTTEAEASQNVNHWKVVSNASSAEESELNFRNGMWRCYMPLTVADNNDGLSFTNGTNTINAGKRGTSSEFVITSSTTGYWAPPATVRVAYAEGFDSTCGTISVTGGVSGATEVLVTEHTSVNLLATAASGYRFVGWSLYAEDTSDATDLPGETQPVTAPDSNAEITYYAVFIRQYTVHLKSVTDGDDNDGSGGKVAIGATEGIDIQTIFDSGTSVTISSTANEGYASDGFYDAATGGNAVSDLTFTLDSDVTYYGRFHTVALPSDYALRGGFCAGTGEDQWNDTNSITMYYVNNVTGSNKVYGYVDIDSTTMLNTDLEFKITYKNPSNNNLTWYTNNGAYVNINSAEADFNSSNGKHSNAKIKFTEAGRYIFVYNLSGTKKIAVYSITDSTEPDDDLLSNCMVFNTSKETKSVWYWLSGQNVSAANVSHTYSGSSPAIGVFNLPDNTNDYYGIGYSVDKASIADSNKTTYDVVPDTSITPYPDRVFYTDQNKVNGAKWKEFNHINGTLASDNDHPKASSVVKLTVTTSSTSTLKSGALYTFYVRDENDDVYRIGSSLTTSSMYWVPCDAGTYQVFATVQDKWGMEVSVLDEITYTVH